LAVNVFIVHQLENKIILIAKKCIPMILFPRYCCGVDSAILLYLELLFIVFFKPNYELKYHFTLCNMRLKWPYTMYIGYAYLCISNLHIKCVLGETCNNKTSGNIL